MVGNDRAFTATPSREPKCSWITAGRSMGLIVGATEGDRIAGDTS